MRSFATTVRGIGRRAHPKQGAPSVAARRFLRTPSASPRAQLGRPRRPHGCHSRRPTENQQRSTHHEPAQRRIERRDSQGSYGGWSRHVGQRYDTWRWLSCEAGGWYQTFGTFQMGGRQVRRTSPEQGAQLVAA
ncbi:hypothetical protein GSI_13632 [Ganoderma sinense ZZ0214-1]|uniref:Uncharacterized protein n=1 Tax=Ganoderma sinense ZZ0214-1 TaxID=1077348 RepID=A0A2G8RQW3_9APHY|nr:hypothetical protein GSI_13632 [Ganoderma sinense ZZ0214-1]